jgi:hypothetical protein
VDSAQLIESLLRLNGIGVEAEALLELLDCFWHPA